MSADKGDSEIYKTFRCHQMPDDIKSQLIKCIDECKEEASGAWTLQTDECTDISGESQLLSFLRLVRDGKIMNGYFFCCELEQTTTGEDIFKVVDQKVKEFGLNWEKCVSVCTAFARPLKRIRCSYASTNQNVKIIHCMIHREVLVSKPLPNELAVVLSEVVTVMNDIKGNLLR